MDPSRGDPSTSPVVPFRRSGRLAITAKLARLAEHAVGGGGTELGSPSKADVLAVDRHRIGPLRGFAAFPPMIDGRARGAAVADELATPR